MRWRTIFSCVGREYQMNAETAGTGIVDGDHVWRHHIILPNQGKTFKKLLDPQSEWAHARYIYQCHNIFSDTMHISFSNWRTLLKWALH